MTPTALSLRRLRKHGVADVVERFISQAGIRKDFLGCIDIIGATDDGIIGVQATSASNVSARVKKARAVPELAVWLKSARFQVHGWAMVGNRWQVKIVELTGDNMVPVVVAKPQRRVRQWQPGELFATSDVDALEAEDAA